MALASNQLSFILSLLLCLVLIAIMQMYRSLLASSRILTIFTGYLGSIVFILILTAISNIEMAVFGKHFQSKFTEVLISLLVSLIISGLVHRVAITTCLLFSLLGLYLVNRISVQVYQNSAINPSITNNPTSKKRK